MSVWLIRSSVTGSLDIGSHELDLTTRITKDPVQQDDQLTDFTIQMRVIHCAVLSPFNGSWNYALASVSSYKTSDNFTTLASK